MRLPPRWRYRVAPAMAKEFFKAHFYPEQFGAAYLTEQRELLPGLALLQCVSAAAAREPARADAALHRRARRPRLLDPDLPGRAADRGGRDRPVPARRRDDRRPARSRRSFPSGSVGLDRVLHQKAGCRRRGRARVASAPYLVEGKRLRRDGRAGRGGGEPWITSIDAPSRHPAHPSHRRGGAPSKPAMSLRNYAQMWHNL